MRMYFTKGSISGLDPTVIPVLNTDARRVGKAPNPTAKPYVLYDLDRSSPPGFGLYVGRKMCTFILQVRVGNKVKKISVGDTASLALSVAANAKLTHLPEFH